MGIFSFGKSKETIQSTDKKAITYGRFTDRNKTSVQHGYWDSSVEWFKQGNYLQAVETLLYYIRDPEQNNVNVIADREKVEFFITQGSKTFHGKAANGIIEAEARIARFTNPPVPVMRKLLALNYALRYCWCGIKDDYFCLFFSTPFEHSSAWKLYSAFREMALNADKQDDLLTEEFESLEPLDNQENILLPVQIVDTKINYLKKWIREALEQVQNSDQQKYSGLNSYRLLALCLRVDYLLAPQGMLMDTLEKIIDIYFKRQQGTDVNPQLIREFEAILNMPEEKIRNSFYQVQSTFAIVSPSTYKQVADFIFEESKSRDYYLKNYEPQHVPVIYEYINGYSLFYFGLLRPLIDLMHLYYKILHSDFFRDIEGTEGIYNHVSGALNKALIIRQIEDIVRRNKQTHPGLVFNHTKLRWNSLSEFSVSFFSEFDFLNLSA
jgi:hypothetical protein